MATSTTHNLYIPKDLHAPLAKYLLAHGLTLGKLMQALLREKLQREGYLSE